MRRRSFGPMTQVFVNEKSRLDLPTNTDREKESVLPPGSATPGGAGRDIGKFEYNTPDSNSDIKPRTLGLPGEQYGHPSNDTYNSVTRRTMTALLSLHAFQDLLEEPEELQEEELKKRQKKQKGKKKRDSKKYYKKNKNKIKRYQKKYRKKNKQKIKRYRKKTKGKNRTRRKASVSNVVALYLGRQ